MLNPNWESIEYQSEEALMNLAEKIADSRNTKRIKKYLDQSAAILYYLEAVAYKDYLEDSQVNNIYQCLIETSGIYDFPVTPNQPSLTVPSNGTTIIIQGTPGERGADGGATDFAVVGAASSQVVDSFAVGLAYAARWDYIVNSTAQRAGTIIATWTEDGASIDLSDTSSPDVNGSTSGIEFSVSYLGGLIRLVADITSGTWDISGSRYFIPNQGVGVNVSSTPLAEGKIFIGDVNDLPSAQTVSGDVSINTSGVTAISSAVIVNADINGSAAIAVSKLAALPDNSSAVVTDGSGKITTVSGVSATEVGYLSGVTSDIQTQLDSKLSGATGAISTVTAVDLTVDRAVISSPTGKIAVSGTSSTELGYVSGVTSAIQTQLNSKVSDTGDTMTGALINTSTIEAQGGIRTAASGAYLKTIVVNIGDWDMDGTLTVNVAHGLADFKKIRIIDIIVRNDADTLYYELDRGNALGGGVASIDTTNVTIYRTAPSDFDTTDFNSTGYNRGWVTITYEA